MISRGTWARSVAAVIAILLLASAASAQKKKKQPKDQPVDTSPMPAAPVPVSDLLDHNIGQVLGAFQAGDIEAMHKYYSDNAVFVRATYESPVIGWQNYAALVQQQRAAFTGGMGIIRRNTNVFVLADMAWACYQWQFDSLYQGKPYTARGQTTLIFSKQGENWLIVHNHTSQICDASICEQIQTQPAPQNPPAAAPAKP